MAFASKIKSRDELAALLAEQKSQGRKIVFTSGSFDLLHAGHATYLEFARTQGDILVVGVNSDRSVSEYKDPLRPINAASHRASLVAALASVTYVFIFDELNNNENIAALKPHIYVKAGDYDKSKLSSAGLVEEYGGQVVIAPLVSGLSSTSVITTIAARYGGIQVPGSEVPRLEAAPAVFLDRDGTINEVVPYLSEPKKFVLIPGALEGMKKLQAAGFRLVIVTNQPGIGLGYFTREDLYLVNRELLRACEKAGVMIDKLYYCPHSEAEHCECRKPRDGMIRRAERELNVTVKDSFVVGDMTFDLAMAKNAGCRSVLVRTGMGGSDMRFSEPATYTAADLNAAADIIIAHKAG